MNKKIIICIFGLFLVFTITLVGQKGELKKIWVPAPALENNLLGTEAIQETYVYLPKSYKNEIRKKYPVVYYLPGYGDKLLYYSAYAIYNGFRFPNSIDKLIKNQKIDEMIIVTPNVRNVFMGAFFTNSSVCGNWEDYIIKNLIPYIDKNFRTIPKNSKRGICGHSMGGYGAFNLAMKYPHIFSSCYAVCPGLASNDGLKKHKPFCRPEIIKEVRTLIKSWEKLTPENAKLQYARWAGNHSVSIEKWELLFAFAYSSSFAPDKKIRVPFFKWGISVGKNGKINREKIFWERMLNGFANWDKKVRKYKHNFLKLKGLIIDFGDKDEYPWIPEGCSHVSDILSKNGIPHQLIRHSGNHGNKLGNRLTQKVFPFFSKIFSTK